MTTHNSRPTLNSVHAVRAFASLCVAALHFYSREQLEPDAILPAWMEFTRLGTDLFFVVSGAVLVFSASKRAQGSGAAVSFLYDRFTRVMPLYWIVTGLTLFVWAISGERLLNNVVGHPEFWSTAFLLPTGVRPAIPVAWSLVNLFLYYLVFSLMIAAPRRFETFFLAAWAAIVIGLRVIGHDFGSPVIALIAHPAALEFIGGIVLMRLALSGRRLPWQLFAIGGVLWFGAFIYSCGPSPTYLNFSDDTARFLTLGISAILFAGAAINFDFKQPRKSNPVLRFLGDTSFGVYLSHVLVIALVARIWEGIAWPGSLDNIIATVVTFSGAIALGWFLHRYVELPLRDITSDAKPMIGNKLTGCLKRLGAQAKHANLN
ncbi:MAG: acyltransferase [Caulobacterales bacterium]